jgi:GNAT superfamily N-acetyltransferase
MNEIRICVDTSPSASDIEALAGGLTQHSLPITQTRGFLPLAVFARDEAGGLAGGISAFVNWNWVHVALVWVAPERRHQGLGSRLLRTVEEEAITRGCGRAHLDTFSYQARPFYERHGYRLFATLEDYPPGHQRFFLRKDL